MAKTGLLIATNLPKVQYILGNISKYVSQTLYISIIDNASPVVSYSDWITGIYVQATKVCNNLDVRVLIGNLKDQELKKRINTLHPIDLVMFDNQKIITGELRDFMMSYISKLKNDFSMLKIGDLDDRAENVGDHGEIKSEGKVYDYAALGGTFDRLHNGHKILLSEGILRSSKGLTVGVTDYNMIKSKRLWELIEPLNLRIENLKQFLTDIDPTLKYTVEAISDVYGPTQTDPKLELLVVSKETLKGGDMVNERRVQNNLSTLAVYCIDLAKESQQESSDEEAKVSSSNRRMRLLGTVLQTPKERPNIKSFPYIIGLTGGIASGKTKIAEKLRQLGAGYVNCDLLGHALYEPGTPMNGTIAATFGDDVMKENGEVDRKKLGSLVFNNSALLTKLNELMWPAILDLAKKRIEELGREGYRVVVMEAAILIQAEWSDHCHQVWTTIIPPEEAVKRVVERNKITADEARSRVKLQPTNMEQVKVANVVFSSMWSYEFTSSQVTKAWQILMKYLEEKEKKLSML